MSSPFVEWIDRVTHVSLRGLRLHTKHFILFSNNAVLVFKGKCLLNITFLCSSRLQKRNPVHVFCGVFGVKHFGNHIWNDVPIVLTFLRQCTHRVLQKFRHRMCRRNYSINKAHDFDKRHFDCCTVYFSRYKILRQASPNLARGCK